MAGGPVGDDLEVMDEQRHVALPILYGAPAYARPQIVPANPVARPIDPDDLPLLAEMTAEDLEDLEDGEGVADGREIGDEVAAPVVPSEEAIAAVPPTAGIKPRPFSIRSLAERIRGARP